MAEQIKAIDIMNYLNYNKEGLNIFWGGLEMSEMKKEFIPAGMEIPPMTTEQFIKQMDDAGYEKVFLAAIKMGSYKARFMGMDYTNEMVYKEVKKFPDRLVGIAGYDPFYIMDSLKAIETAVKKYGFKGVYAHTLGWGMAANDRRMYPCYAKCVELDIPFSMQIGQSFERLPSEPGRPIYVDPVVLDFPELKFICSHTGYPWCDEVVSMAWKHVNVYVDMSAHPPRNLPMRMRSLFEFMDSGRGRIKTLYGTNSQPMKMFLDQFMALPLKDETKVAVLRENAIKLFKL